MQSQLARINVPAAKIKIFAIKFLTVMYSSGKCIFYFCMYITIWFWIRNNNKVQLTAIGNPVIKCQNSGFMCKKEWYKHRRKNFCITRVGLVSSSAQACFQNTADYVCFPKNLSARIFFIAVIVGPSLKSAFCL